jgi:hypothetical protein
MKRKIGCDDKANINILLVKYTQVLTQLWTLTEPEQTIQKTHNIPP